MEEKLEWMEKATEWSFKKMTKQTANEWKERCNKKRAVKMFRELQKRWTPTIHLVCACFCCINSCWKLFFFVFRWIFGSFAKDIHRVHTHTICSQTSRESKRTASKCIHTLCTTCARPLYSNYSCANKLQWKQWRCQRKHFVWHDRNRGSISSATALATTVQRVEKSAISIWAVPLLARC